MKYILIEINVRTGEYEVSQTSVHAIHSNTNVENFAEKVAETFYGECESKNKDGYEFYDGLIVTSVNKVREIPEAHYEILNQYL